ncbi:hypothetical protein CDL12_04238 [Handroanthus impetiginosus]|uniref:Wall-associated receptor kinase galacturonan-binding domain-containing protein n=1 Tax=Handroanthus impetiginosus TaxID=429701 RepID=A0A2G9HZX2_9LAMI|nr:hypothetical protein CDL12_04238 [Handroanthus impetiginosus]
MHPNPNQKCILFIHLSIYFPSGFSSQMNQEHTTCFEPFRCGSINISYPFWGGRRLPSCGRQGFEIHCNEDVPLLNISSLFYRILEIDFSNHTLKVAREYLWNNSCPSILHNITLNPNLFEFPPSGGRRSHCERLSGGVAIEESSIVDGSSKTGVEPNSAFGLTVPTSLFIRICVGNELFSFSDQSHIPSSSKVTSRNITLYFNCMSNKQEALPNEFSCHRDGVNTINLFKTRDASASPGSEIACSNYISVTLNHASAESLKTPMASTVNVLQRSLTSGFSVKWSPDKDINVRQHCTSPCSKDINVRQRCTSPCSRGVVAAPRSPLVAAPRSADGPPPRSPVAPNEPPVASDAPQSQGILVLAALQNFKSCTL